jgi:hypothetical protein
MERITGSNSVVTSERKHATICVAERSPSSPRKPVLFDRLNRNVLLRATELVS